MLLAALLLKKHGLSVNELYTHNHWMGHPDSIVQGARKNCPLYIPVSYTHLGLTE